MSEKTFAADREFLSKYCEMVELKTGDSKLLICPALQGRVFTSTSNGDEGDSYGWINYNLIASQKLLSQCNNWGGEDRFWIGPEGGQFSIFFPPGTNYDISQWKTPAPIDSEPWDLVDAEMQKAFLTKAMELRNTSNHLLKLKIEREVRLLDDLNILQEIGVDIPAGISKVGFSSVNKLYNESDFEWTRETGMLSIWILGQFISTDHTTVILPFNQRAFGPLINDTYFGKIGNDRLKTLNNVFLFKGDGKKRGKIGLGPQRAKPSIGSYDRQNGILTIVRFSFDPTKTDYVNSMWEHQEEPFVGDVINSYNDGPLPDGSQMGPFYELETSSAAANLKPGGSIKHIHSTFHFAGEEYKLEQLSKQLLGVGFEGCF